MEIKIVIGFTQLQQFKVLAQWFVVLTVNFRNKHCNCLVVLFTEKCPALSCIIWSSYSITASYFTNQ
ncbi:hypothetical protein EG68_09950 [Paragonimus skrjabini miyazakii]|uniref:Uncharacterized protein n=1 Tax=Paragonimus skrjabini miyazakii TaxID=59628 RepID=A0A8S9YL90_9TREM|nr:hypothetical protein EG68_09950 [Paragonimus skrjabini miyazakii]